MKSIIPPKLRAGDKVMVVAPSDSLLNITEIVKQKAAQRLIEMGLVTVFAQHTNEIDDFESSSIASRVADLHEAFTDSSVKGVFTAFGGYNCNQLLSHLDWDLIRNNPKVFIGFSDTTALGNAIFAKTGLVTYSGPSFSRFGQELYFDYTLEHFQKCILQESPIVVAPSETWSDDWWLKTQDDRVLLKNEGWVVLNEGHASGTILGGNLSTFNLLQGTEYFPDIRKSIIFLEDDSESKLAHFDRDLESLTQQAYFGTVRAIVIGRFQKSSAVSMAQLHKVIASKESLRHIPVLANADFGHTDPIFTFPIGGEVELDLKKDGATMHIQKH